jgi:hypothetical protein
VHDRGVSHPCDEVIISSDRARSRHAACRASA